MRRDIRCSLMAGVAALLVGVGACSPRPATTDTEGPPGGARLDGARGGSAADSVTLSVDKGEYRAGERITLTLRSSSGSGYTFNPCSRTIEREERGAWTPVPESDRVCTMEAWILDPRGTRSGATELPAKLTPGQYRVALQLSVESPAEGRPAAVTVSSAAFTVR